MLAVHALSASVADKRPLSEVTREAAKLAASPIATRDSAHFADDEKPPRGRFPDGFGQQRQETKSRQPA